MALDKNGQPLEIGDEVMIPARVVAAPNGAYITVEVGGVVHVGMDGLLMDSKFVIKDIE